MKLIKTTIALLLLATLSSCGSSEKKLTGNENTTVTDTTDQKMANTDYEELGFLRGVVRSGEEAGSCGYVIEILGGIVAQKVDPIDMPESYKKNNQLVWIKFGGLKQVNRCPEAQPVTIKDIKERAK